MKSVGNFTESPTTSGDSVRDLMVQQKNMSASIREKTTALADAVGTTKSANTDTNLIGLAKNLATTVGWYGFNVTPDGNTVRSYLLNLGNAVGNSYETPTTADTTVRGLLTAIKENTASGGGGGGGGGSSDLTIVNEKTTALATAIGTADDTSSTVSVIGLLKSITDKY